MPAGEFKMNDIIIREAKESDLPAIEKLMKELIETINNTEGINIQQVRENCQDLFHDTNSHFWVAEIKRVIIGFINFTTRKTILHHGASGLIDELIITKNYRNKGIGKRLVLAAIEQCKKFGCCEVEVSTERVNAKAREFYKKCGFKENAVLFEIDL